MSWNRVNSLWGMTTAMCSIRLSYVVVLNVTYKNNALEKQKFVLDALRITEYRIINLTSYIALIVTIIRIKIATLTSILIMPRDKNNFRKV